MNELSGNIPSSLGELQMVTDIYLSRNSLQGQIPNTFSQLFSVINLNLSHNFFSELIPDSLANLSISSLIGNQVLCGAPLLRFPPCSKNVATNSSTRKLKLLKYILPFTAFGVILACLGLSYIFNWKRKAKTLDKADDTHLHHNRVISHHELLRATSNFSEANLLGRGGFGSVYRGCLDDGMLVAVKVLNLEVGGALKSFDAECQVLRMVRHRNLIKIISVCSNINFKALILQFMSNGSLDKWLYSGNYFLNLPQRLNIMLDVSLALEYLHHHHPQVVLHCDLKPTNVLLDEKMVAHVSDFGIAKLLFGDSSSIISASTPGTIGYIAPEYATTGAVSRMGDVYSFGILLLETCTRKKPVDAMFAGESNLREWVLKAYPSAILDVVDRNLLYDYSNYDRYAQDRTTVHLCLVSIIELGLLCSNYSPRERISMSDVTTRLQKIKMEHFSNLPN